jgi:RNA polymerase sigma factor (sigma-70 family)
MPKPLFADILCYLRRTCGAQAARDLTDGELLKRFLADRQDPAFTVLVQRHGRMVQAVCQRVLGDAHSAEDAFQATFMVLVRRAASLRGHKPLGSWLHAVARRVALRARAQAGLRRQKERRYNPMPRSEPLDDLTWRELRLVLDEEITRLPEKLRAPIVLCYLEGRTNKQAAEELGCPKSSLASRLEQGRELLRHQLTHRGMALSASALATTLGEKALGAPVGALLTINTAKAAATVGAGKLAVGGFVSAQAIALAKETLASMVGIKGNLIVLLLVFSLGGAGFAGYGWLAEKMQHGITASGKSVGVPFKIDPDSSEGTVSVSGRLASKSWDIVDFTEVEIESGFQAEIGKGNGFKVTTSSDDNVIEHIAVVKEGNTLKIGLAPQANLHRKLPLKAAIILPTLDALTARDQSKAVLKGFRSERGLKLLLAEGSTVEGTLDVGSADFEVRDGSTLELTGTAINARLSVREFSHLKLQDFILKQCTINLADASAAWLTVRSDKPFSAMLSDGSSLNGFADVGEIELKLKDASRATLRGSAKTTTVKAGESSAADLSRLSVEDATIILSESSRATIGVRNNLTYVLSSDCQLEYSGDPRSVTGSKSRGATIRRLP